MNNRIDVLVVDDDPDYCELAEEALRSCGRHNVLCVHDGTDALDYMHAHGKFDGRDPRHQPRLVLLDLKMERMQGLEVVQRMRADQHTAHVPVIVLSGTDDQQALRACYDAGANSVVRKTADFNELRRKLGGIFAFWLDANEQNRASQV